MEEKNPMRKLRAPLSRQHRNRHLPRSKRPLPALHRCSPNPQRLRGDFRGELPVRDPSRALRQSRRQLRLRLIRLL